jgi:hypothetical protein
MRPFHLSLCLCPARPRRSPSLLSPPSPPPPLSLVLSRSGPPCPQPRASPGAPPASAAASSSSSAPSRARLPPIHSAPPPPWLLLFPWLRAPATSTPFSISRARDLRRPAPRIRRPRPGRPPPLAAAPRARSSASRQAATSSSPPSAPFSAALPRHRCRVLLVPSRDPTSENPLAPLASPARVSPVTSATSASLPCYTSSSAWTFVSTSAVFVRYV